MFEFDRPGGGERCVLVSLHGEDPRRSEEFSQLASAAGAIPVAELSGRLRRIDPATFLGAGKVGEVAELLRTNEAQLTVFDHELTPAQERNLERALSCRVLDRAGLILDIFAQRARSFEGKLQVELAQLRHLSTRLVRGWSHLERQKGGIGLRGPGESQLETDRRLLTARVDRLTRRLTRFERQRDLSRGARNRTSTPTVALVGYTNAGKSTLFNALTQSDAFAADQLFATLDPTLRRLELPAQPLVLADTVGFVQDLPHALVAAFRATLEETRRADLLLHVIDASDPERRERIGDVEAVLREIEASEVPVLHVYNKTDRTDQPARVRRDGEGQVRDVWLSARTGAGLDGLREALAVHFGGQACEGWLTLPLTAGRLRGRLHQMAAVRQEFCDEAGWHLRVRLPKAPLEAFCERHDLHLHARAPVAASACGS